VRGDLSVCSGNCCKRRERFDYILIETTGLADPGPVAQELLRRRGSEEDFELDAVVTLVDARTCGAAGRLPTAADQIAFADVLVLNKTDLVDAGNPGRCRQTFAWHQ